MSFFVQFSLIRRLNRLPSVNYAKRLFASSPIIEKNKNIDLEKSKFRKIDFDSENSSKNRKLLSIGPSHLQRLIQERQYLVESRTDDGKATLQFSKEFIDFLISWSISKSNDVRQDRFDPVEASRCVAWVIFSMKETLRKLKKKKGPREKCLEEMSRLYLLGLKKLANRNETVTTSPKIVQELLCHYADACCNFDFDPVDSKLDVWSSWFQASKRFLEQVESVNDWDTDENKKAEEEFHKAYPYLLSIIIDVTLRFRRITDFEGLQSVWESRLGEHVSNFKDRTNYILSQRMSTLEQKHGVEFDGVVAKRLAKSGVERSFAEYRFRAGRGSKPQRTIDGSMRNDSDED